MVANQSASWADVRICALLACTALARGWSTCACRPSHGIADDFSWCVGRRSLSRSSAQANHAWRDYLPPARRRQHRQLSSRVRLCSAALLTHPSAAPVPAEPPPVAQAPAQPPAQPVQPTAQPPASPIITPAPQPTTGEPAAAPIAGGLPTLSGLSSAARRNATLSGLMPAYAIECVGLTSTQR